MTQQTHGQRSVAMLALARELAASPGFGYYVGKDRERLRWSASALAETERVVRALAARQPPAAMAEAARALAGLARVPQASRDRGMRDQLQAIAQTLPDRIGLTPHGVTPNARVRDLDDLRYLLAWLQRIWKAAPAPPDGGAPARAPAANPPARASGQPPMGRPASPSPEEPEIDPRLAKLLELYSLT